ncbi:hypothetical protein Anas_08053 [Armadillidium nasatum]|uniref:Uncharacterized protein n=1 Tax=Armadillidium nasatum TaxID=96803 RepID=A0A5N5TAH2_9CRUS|nr:hypothetical protein Anas_08053 [Armadillidium nasatum]
MTPVPHLSAPSKVLLASQTGPKTTEDVTRFSEMINNLKRPRSHTTSMRKRSKYENNLKSRDEHKQTLCAGKYPSQV